jgi:hypothetical protein
MWSDGEPIDPSPTIDQAVNGGFPWLEIQCARCKTPSDVDLAVTEHPPTHVCARPRRPAALSKMRQGGPTPICDAAAVGTARPPLASRELSDRNGRQNETLRPGLL